MTGAYPVFVKEHCVTTLKSLYIKEGIVLHPFLYIGGTTGNDVVLPNIIGKIGLDVLPSR